MFPLETLIMTYSILCYRYLFLMKMVLLVDREGVINVTRLRGGGDVIYAS